MAKDHWQTLRKATRLEKINKSLSLPTFSFACGRTTACLSSTAAPTSVANGSLQSTSFHATFSVEFWCLSPGPADATEKVLVGYNMFNDAVDQFKVSLVSNKVRCIFRKGAAYSTLNSTSNFPVGEWFHIAITWDGTTATVYINGIADGTLALAASLDQDSGGDYAMFVMADFAPPNNPFTGKLDELRIWNDARTASEVLYYYNKPVNNSETGLVYYFRMDTETDEGSGNYSIVDSTDAAHTITFIGAYIRVITTDSAPLKLGASFIVAKSVITLGKVVSLVYPIVPPDDNNFGLCVSWTDDDGVFQRRLLFNASGTSIDVAPFPATYNGERLESPFTFEIWNIDGNATVDLATAITAYISDKTKPTTSIDSTPIAAATPAWDSTIFENFPLTFPLTFEDAANFG